MSKGLRSAESLTKQGINISDGFLIHCRTNIELEKSVQCSKPQEFNIKGGHNWQNLSSKHDLNLWGPHTALSPFSISHLSQAGSTRGPHERFNSVLLTLAFVGSFFVSSVRSSNSHPDLLLITSTTTPLFQIHTGPQHWTFTF